MLEGFNAESGRSCYPKSKEDYLLLFLSCSTRGYFFVFIYY